MKIHEYQAKEILRRYGVATPRGKVIEDPGEARAICEEMGGKCVVKAQIHAGALKALPSHLLATSAGG